MPFRYATGQFIKKAKFEQVEKVTKVIMKVNQERKRKKEGNGMDIGVRLVDTSFVGENMWCVKCRIPLSFSNVI